MMIILLTRKGRHIDTKHDPPVCPSLRRAFHDLLYRYENWASLKIWWTCTLHPCTVGYGKKRSQDWIRFFALTPSAILFDSWWNPFSLLPFPDLLFFPIECIEGKRLTKQKFSHFVRYGSCISSLWSSWVDSLSVSFESILEVEPHLWKSLQILKKPINSRDST